MNKEKLKTPLLMIGGSGRSGTTVLSHIFSQHPKICDVPELRFLIDPDGLLDFYLNIPNWSPYHYDLRLKRLRRMLLQLSKNPLPDFFYKVVDKLQGNLPVKLTPKYHNVNVAQFCPEYPQLVEKLINDLASFRFNGYWTGNNFLEKKRIYFMENEPEFQVKTAMIFFLDSLFTSILQKQQSDFYLEKNTWNILWFDKILQLIPNGKLVHIYRDPRDVIASYCTQRWMPTNPIHAAHTYNSLLNHWGSIKKRIPSDSFIEISLEGLVENPQETLSNVCEFWGINLDANMLKVDLKKSNSQRWKKEFSASTVIEIEKIVYSHLKEFRYE